MSPVAALNIPGMLQSRLIATRLFAAKYHTFIIDRQALSGAAITFQNIF
jgi:hypothetical protein